MRPAGAASRRLALLDLARGGAIIAMIAYHFCFDLALLGWLVTDFRELRWVAFRTPILGSFLFIAGIGLALAEIKGQAPARFWRRVAVIAGAALLVTAGSYVMFPRSFIYFGVLHAIALMSVFARPLVRFGGWLVPAGLVIVLAGMTLQHPLFNSPALQWIGMMTFKPLTEDYVPLFPWFGAMLAGVGAAVLFVQRPGTRDGIAAWPIPASMRWVAWLGRHSLIVYLLHQPLLIGALMLVRRFI